MTQTPAVKTFSDFIKHRLRLLDISENEFAKRLGHSNSGGVNPVIAGSKPLPIKKIEAWGLALELEGPDFDQWVELALVAWGPTWLSRWVVEHRKLKREIEELKALIYGRQAAELGIRYNASSPERPQS